MSPQHVWVGETAGSTTCPSPPAPAGTKTGTSLSPSPPPPPPPPQLQSGDHFLSLAKSRDSVDRRASLSHIFTRPNIKKVGGGLKHQTWSLQDFKFCRPSVCIILLIATSLSDSFENIPSIINRLNSIEANFALKESGRRVSRLQTCVGQNVPEIKSWFVPDLDFGFGRILSE